MKCRFCKSERLESFLDLGMAPPSNDYVDPSHRDDARVYYPLIVAVCRDCWLVQARDFTRRENLFTDDYAYFSSVSSTWLAHARRYVEMITERLGLDERSLVVEVASNDGYLLKNFVASGVPCVGFEPTRSTADAAEAQGITVRREFFGTDTARAFVGERGRADLLIGNNVYAHVPDIRDFTHGLAIALKPGGTLTLEFPHLLRLLEERQFDTVYHEHFSYLSLAAVQRIFADAGLRVLDVEELGTHGGSLRVYGVHADDERVAMPAVARILALEKEMGLESMEPYESFSAEVQDIRDQVWSFLVEQRRAGKSVAAYGAAAKGNTLLNYCGVRGDLIRFICDAAPSKQGRFAPGSHIPIVPPDALKEHRPDFVFILPWNLADEIVSSHAYIADWGGQFVVAIPELRRVPVATQAPRQ